MSTPFILDSITNATQEQHILNDLQSTFSSDFSSDLTTHTISPQHITNILKYISKKLDYRNPLTSTQHKIIKHIFTHYYHIIKQTHISQILNIYNMPSYVIDYIIPFPLDEQNEKIIEISYIKYERWIPKYTTWYNQPNIHPWHFIILTTLFNNIRCDWNNFWQKISNTSPPSSFIISLIWHVQSHTGEIRGWLQPIPISFYTSQNLQEYITYVKIYTSTVIPTSITNNWYHDKHIHNIIKKFNSHNIFLTIPQIIQNTTDIHMYHITYILLQREYFDPSITLSLTKTQLQQIIKNIQKISLELELELELEPQPQPQPKQNTIHNNDITAILPPLLNITSTTLTLNQIEILCTTIILPQTFQLILTISKHELNETMFINLMRANNIPMIEYFLSSKFPPQEHYIYNHPYPESMQQIIILFIQYGLPISPQLYMFITIMEFDIQIPTINSISPHITHTMTKLKEYNARKNKLKKHTNINKIKNIKKIDYDNLLLIFETYPYTIFRKKIEIVPGNLQLDQTILQAGLHNPDFKVIIYIYNTYNYIPSLYDVLSIESFKIRWYSLCRFYPSLSSTLDLHVDAKMHKVDKMSDSFLL